MQRWIALFALTAASWAFPTLAPPELERVVGGVGSASAQSTVSPYFLILVDTSGSMNQSTASVPAGTNSCGRPANRMSDAKCVLQRVINGYGEINFGLASFNTTCTGLSCSANCPNGECGCTCSNECTTNSSAGVVRVPIGANNQQEILNWLNFSCSGSCTATSGAGVELLNPPDNQLRARTPLEGSLRGMRAYLEGTSSPLRNDPFLSCRPVAVILLTDGEETCGGNPGTAATLLRSVNVGGVIKDVRTYVVGFGINGSAQLNSIASNGGTTSPYYASDERALAVAFSQIISDSVLTEVCDQRDNDCDARIDEGFELFCNRRRTPPLTSNAPGVGICTEPTEVCDGVDDDCDGMADEGALNACGTCGAAPAEVCNRLDDDCDNIIDEGVCGGCSPTAEICDGLDNDCDTRVDEAVTRSCSTNVGICRVGTQVCVNGTWQGCSGVLPTEEVCNGLDDDCNGVTDGQIRACGTTDVGPCQRGSQVCVNGTYGQCIGGIEPGTETCNGIDDDCDGMIDEMSPGGGAACGTDQGACMRGTITCVNGSLICQGGIDPSPEICNNIDDDCNGVIDDGLPLGQACTTGNNPGQVGICLPGEFRCVNGAVECTGEVGPETEICNRLDDDCDTKVDETDPTLTCGSNIGECRVGNPQCINGSEECVGGVTPSPEICDCLDNDCDGQVDEMLGSDPLCPAGTACVACGCAAQCSETEFGDYICPTTRMTQMVGDLCYCVRETCDEARCAAQTRSVNGEAVCAPNRTDMAPCQCAGTDCVASCEGVTCPSGQACDPRDPLGRCVRDDCLGLGCPTGEVCDTMMEQCVPNPCLTAGCPADQACRAIDGEARCEPSCADVSCSATEVCQHGECVADVCANSTCGTQVCDPSDGECIDDRCATSTCGGGTVCGVRNGTCIEDPCVRLICPGTQVCVDGECAEMMAPPPPDSGVIERDAGMLLGMDAAVNTQIDSGPPETRVLATGGGGCLCAAAGRTDDTDARRASGVVLLLLGALQWRRRRSTRAQSVCGGAK